MSTSQNSLVIGLAGSFGSGCSTLGKALKNMGFTIFSLSDIAKKEWEKKHPGKSAEKDARRSELQDVGNELRRLNGNDYLAKEIMAQAEEEIENKRRLLFDSIRHTEEIRALRRRFSGFYLVGVDCPKKDRWERVKSKYHKFGLTEEQFRVDDNRDKNEADKPYGQQVELCLYEADIFIDNEKTIDESIVVRRFREKIKPYMALISGEKLRRPTPSEMYMSVAYTASLMSGCVKRQVGAIIMDEKNDMILSAGYNENPRPLKPCIEEYTICNKDRYKMKYFQKLKDAGLKCPKCKKLLENVSPPYICDCGCDLDGFFIPDRAVSQCTAIHAEEKALMSAGGRNLEGATLYATTFPCAKCANQIIHSKIGRVVYVAAYPDPLAAKALIEAKIPTDRLEGVKARAYFKLFSSWRKEKEDEILAGNSS